MVKRYIPLKVQYKYSDKIRKEESNNTCEMKWEFVRYIYTPALRNESE